MFIILFIYLINRGKKQELEAFDLLIEHYDLPVRNKNNNVALMIDTEKHLDYKIYRNARKKANIFLGSALALNFIPLFVDTWIEDSSLFSDKVLMGWNKLLAISMLVGFIFLILSVVAIFRSETKYRKESWKFLLEKNKISYEANELDVKNWKKELPIIIDRSLDLLKG